ncbi:MAG TPA: hypothetical protein VN734_17070 [Acidobacteriaceae bacterium]|nr:hypothetical protein [Acidobacteriaceae bacterium]
MLALLSKLVPIRDWVYFGVFVALIAGFAYYTHHERVIGEQKIEALDSKLAAAQAAHVQKVESDANVDVGKAVAQYSAAVSVPLLPAPVLVCHAAPSGSGAVRSDASAAGSGDGAPGVPAESTVPFDPAPAVIEDGRDADAQVTLLQAYIRACQKAGACR